MCDTRDDPDRQRQYLDMLALGRRRFGHITGPERFLAARRRARGLCEALADAGVAFTANDVLYGKWSEAWGREAARLVMRTTPGVDAIFCGSDQIARGVSDTLRLIEPRATRQQGTVCGPWAARP